VNKKEYEGFEYKIIKEYNVFVYMKGDKVPFEIIHEVETLSRATQQAKRLIDEEIQASKQEEYDKRYPNF
jgi:hypothetical protein